MKWPKRRLFEPPPSMPAWYWAIYWFMPVIGIGLFFWQDQRRISLTGLYVGVSYLILIPLMWKKAPPRVRPWVTLFLAVGALVLLGVVVFGWPF